MLFIKQTKQKKSKFPLFFPHSFFHLKMHPSHCNDFNLIIIFPIPQYS